MTAVADTLSLHQGDQVGAAGAGSRRASVGSFTLKVLLTRC
jgi:hypothetical protein